MNTHSTLLKIISYVMFIIFLVAAALQYNDPDAAVWVVIYVIAAIVTALFISRKVNWKITAVCAVGLLVACGIVGYEALKEGGLIASSLDTWQMQNMAEEKAREAGGLFILSLWSFIMTLKLKQ